MTCDSIWLIYIGKHGAVGVFSEYGRSLYVKAETKLIEFV